VGWAKVTDSRLGALKCASMALWFISVVL